MTMFLEEMVRLMIRDMTSLQLPTSYTKWELMFGWKTSSTKNWDIHFTCLLSMVRLYFHLVLELNFLFDTDRIDLHWHEKV